jgi:negative regulator of sigma E activity
MQLRGCNHTLCNQCKEIMLQHDNMCRVDHGFARVQCPQCNEYELLSEEALEIIRQNAWNDGLLAFSMYVSSSDDEASTDGEEDDHVDQLLEELMKTVEMRWRPWLDMKYLIQNIEIL